MSDLDADLYGGEWPLSLSAFPHPHAHTTHAKEPAWFAVEEGRLTCTQLSTHHVNARGAAYGRVGEPSPAKSRMTL